MKILDAGHKYTLESYDGGTPTTLTFMKREGENFPFNSGHYGGTNCQEVLRALIDRSQYLQKQKPCAETEAIVASLQTALMLFELRAARLHGISLELKDLDELVRVLPCNICGHSKCECKNEKDNVL